jgi:hypothetical protein
MAYYKLSNRDALSVGLTVAANALIARSNRNLRGRSTNPHRPMLQAPRPIRCARFRQRVLRRQKKPGR